MKKHHPGAWGYMPVQTGYGQHGIPDHIYCVPIKITPDMVGKTVGLFVGIEAKTERGRLTKFQKMVLNKITEAKGVATVIYGVDEVPSLEHHIK